jgi:translation initiation factor 1A
LRPNSRERDETPLDVSDPTIRVAMPRQNQGEIFGVADQLLGASKIRVMCADGKTRMGRIPGKLKKRMWIREGDLLIIRPWEFQDEKAEIRYRYTRTQAVYLSRKKILPKAIDIF